MDKPEEFTVSDPELAFEAFEIAIAGGRLSPYPDAKNSAGMYMHMGRTKDGFDCFKRIGTREYLP